MAVSKITAEFDSCIEQVWNIVTSLEDYSWRSDLSKIEVIDPGREFVEYTKDGYSTRFVIKACEFCRRYAFDMENENMTGHWIGTFFTRDGKTVIEFTEDVTAKKVVMKPFVKPYLKKQQEAYIRDLRRALGK